MSHNALGQKITQFAEDDGILDTNIDRLTLVRWSQAGEAIHMLQRPALCIIAQGQKRVMLGDSVVMYGPASYLVASLDLPITGIVTEASPELPYLCFCLYLDVAILSDILVSMPPAVAPESGQGLSLHAITPEILDAATRLTALLGEPNSVGALAPLVERELLFRLMNGPSGGTIRAIASGESRIGRIARAVAWLKAHFDEPFDGPELAQVAGMSVSSFHEHFRAATAMSPLQYQKQLRLQHARQIMLADSVDAAVAGFRVGYDSPSQFSREYRRLFGSPPQRDIGRLRAQPRVTLAI